MSAASTNVFAVSEGPFGRGLPVAGLSILAGFAVTVGIWSATAPLEAAVVAPGLVNVNSNVRQVQHLEGGIVSAILVHEGDRVRQGQPLVRLQETPAATNLNEIRRQYFDALAVVARLRAERDGASTVRFPAELQGSEDPSAAGAVAAQTELFHAHRKALLDLLAGQSSVSSGAAGEAASRERQADDARHELALVNQENDLLTQMMDKGLVSKVRVLSVRQRRAELQAQIAGYQASSSNARQSADQARFHMTEIRATTQQDVLSQMKDAQARLLELSEKLRAAEDVANRTDIRSPVDGTIVGLAVHTIGGVVSPGEVLMTVVPVGDELVVQAKINPDDIDQVTTGMPTSVWLATLTRRNSYPLSGQVRTISADRITDEKTGNAYYLAQIKLDPSSLRSRAVVLQPGMSADVMIKTGTRSAISYILGPLFQSMSFGTR